MTRNAIMNGLFQTAMVILLAGAAVPARADLVSNGNFNAGTPSGAFQTVPVNNSTTIADWTVTGPSVTSGSVDWIGTYWQAPPSGGHSIDLDGNSQGGIKQSGIATTSGDTYDLTFYLSGNPDGGPTPKLVDVGATGATSQVFSFSTAGISHADMGYVLESYIFTATSSSTTIFFTSETPGAYGGVIGGVSLALATTPEPGFYGILALGLSGLFFVLFCRRQSQS